MYLPNQMLPTMQLITYHSDLNSNSWWFNGADFIYNYVTKTKYVNCNFEKNPNANVNLNKIDNEVLTSTSAKPIIN